MIEIGDYYLSKDKSQVVKIVDKKWDIADAFIAIVLNENRYSNNEIYSSSHIEEKYDRMDMNDREWYDLMFAIKCNLINKINNDF